MVASSWLSGRLASLAGVAAFVTLLSPSAFGGECPPGYPKNLPCPQEAWETVELENSDRIARLERLATRRVGFEFYSEKLTPEEHGLADYPVDIPVLRVVASQDVFFDSGSDQIRQNAFDLLATISASLKLEPPDVALFVAGHTDWDGGFDYNYDLGLRRARSVAAALVQRGIYQASIFQVSFGEYVPIDDNNTAPGRARNRRVEFLFAARAEAVVTYLERQEIALCSELGADASAPCKREIVFPVETIAVPQSHLRIVSELAEQANEIRADRSLSEIEAATKLVAIGHEQTKIPIVYVPVKIPISIGKQ